MYAVGHDSGIQHQSAPKGGPPWSWTGWIDRLGDDGGACIGKPAAVSSGGPGTSSGSDPRFKVYTIGINSALHTKEWRFGVWGSWENLGGLCVGELAYALGFVFAIRH